MAFVYIFRRRCFCISMRAAVASIQLKIPYHTIAAINLSKIAVITQNSPISLDELWLKFVLFISYELP
jgi:hypothetical protein